MEPKIHGTARRGMIRKNKCSICGRSYKLAQSCKEDIHNGLPKFWPAKQCGRHMELGLRPKKR
jgi:hypothetical protein